MSDTQATILLSVAGDDAVRIGLPPKAHTDFYFRRSLPCGSIHKEVSHVFCTPDSRLYCIENGDMYTGSLPSNENQQWFDNAKRVGRFEWIEARLVCVHPEGDLYVVTHSGDLYCGPQPKNENRSWFHEKATLIEKEKWSDLLAIFFDPEGCLYAVTADSTLLKGPKPEKADWLTTSEKIGQEYWERLTFFIQFSPEGKLFCIDKYSGNFYSGDPPTSLDSDYLKDADYLGTDYRDLKFYNLTKDRTIHNIISFDFLPEQAERISETPIVIEEKIYDNRNSTTPLRHNFSFEKRIMESSSFTYEKGFTFEFGVEATFTAGVPFIGETETTVSINTGTSHTWTLDKTNETEITVSSSTDVEIDKGKCVKMKASIVSALLNVPYEAKVLTKFGYETTVKGVWKGTLHFNLKVTQEDYEG